MQYSMIFSVSAQTMLRQDKKIIVANSIKYLTAHVSFKTNDWADLTKTLVFFNRKNNIKLERDLGQDNSIYEQDELNLSEGEWLVSCVGLGSNGTKVETYPIRLEVLPGMENTGRPMTPEQQTLAERAFAIANALMQKAESGEFNVVDQQLIPESVNAISGGVVFNELENKQDKLIAGSGIRIAADGKTISAVGGSGDSGDGYDDAPLWDAINGKQPAGDYALRSEIPAPYDDTELREEIAKKQPAGDYALKSEIPDAYDDKELREEIAGKQPIGDYALKSEIPDAYDDTEIKGELASLNGDIAELQNTVDEPVAAGKVWTTTADGAEWAEPSGSDFSVSSNQGIEFVSSKDRTLRIASATTIEINNRNSSRKPIVPTTLNQAVTAALTDAHHITLTAEQQQIAQEVLGILSVEGVTY